MIWFLLILVVVALMTRDEQGLLINWMQLLGIVALVGGFGIILLSLMAK